MYIIALTGNIGCGKTTVANYFRALNIEIIHADHIVHKLLNSDTGTGQKILKVFGTLERKKLRKIIFKDPEQKKKLEGILHPLVRKEILKQLKTITSKYCLIELPLLIEKKGFYDFIDHILLVTADKQEQINRLKNKLSESEINLILDQQPDEKTRLKFADDVIKNTNTLEELEQKIEKTTSEI